MKTLDFYDLVKKERQRRRQTVTQTETDREEVGISHVRNNNKDFTAEHSSNERVKGGK